MADTILSINSTARGDDSASRPLVDRAVARLAGAGTRVIDRDLSRPLPQISQGWLAANWTPAADRSAEQKQALAQSDALIAELKAADTIVIGAAMYNFTISASLKAWIDLVARNGETFTYTEEGPKGLLTGKRAILVVTTGGTPIDGAMDHATPYLRGMLGFLGITDVEVIDAGGLVSGGDTVLARAQADIDRLAPAAEAALETA